MPIVTPGKRPGVRLSKSKVFGKKGGFGKKKGGYAGLNLTPMVDMMTIIVIYLLQNFSAEGNMINIVEEIAVPKISTSGKIKRNLQLGVVLASSGPGTPATFALILDGDPLTAEEKDNPKQPGRPAEFADSVIPDLVDKLSEKRESFVKMQQEIKSGIAFDGNINIQADVEVPFKLLKKVMASCAQAGYGNINFAAIQGGSGSAEGASAAK